MGKVGEVIAGAALIAGAIALDVATSGAAIGLTAAEFGMLVSTTASMGASIAMAGVSGLMQGAPQGAGTSSQNPIKAWDISYGLVKVPGTVIFVESGGGILSGGSNPSNKNTNFVYMLGGHSIQSIEEIRLGGKTIPLGPGGSGAISTEWTFSPPSNQGQLNISTISRSGGVVTMKLVSSLAGQTGKQLAIQHVHDNTFNGTFTVTQPNPLDSTTYTYLCGGADTSSSGGYVLTTLPDWKNRCHVDRHSCLGNHTGTFPELMNVSNLWTSEHLNLGKASCYIGYYYDEKVFAQGIPQSSFIIKGKNDIYDPRLGDITDPAARVYTTNAALCCADYLSNKTWGFGLEYGTDIPLPQLIAAANLCDEDVPLAAGGTEKRYSLNMTFSLTRGRGEVLQDMLNACAGRISIVSGQYLIVPGAWVGPTLSLSDANLIGPIEYKPIMTVRDAANGIKGTYTSPVNNWQPGDIPPFCKDILHGYTSDRWLTADGGERVWKDVSFTGVTSCPQAQRIAKIDLERLRREGRLTLHCDMSAYPAVALDVIEFSHPRYGWVNKTFEVLSSKLVVKADANGGAPTLGVDLDLAETDSTVYDWFISEELTPADTQSPAIDSGQTVLGPQFLELESGAITSYTGADGIVIPRILASWLTAPDAAVQQGGYVQVEYQRVGDTLWTPAGGAISGSQTQVYIANVVSGWSYNVQVQGYTAKGQTSGWVQAGPITVSADATTLVASSVTYPDGTPVSALQPAQAGADQTAAQPISYTGISNNLIPNGNFILGNVDGWVGNGGYGADGTGGGGAIFLPAVNGNATSPSWNVTPGQKYRITFTGWNGGGTNGVYLRIGWSATYAPNIIPDGATHNFSDFLSNGELSGVPNTDYTFEWVAPDGAYFASLTVAQTGTAGLAFNRVSAQDFAGVSDWGADTTSLNIPTEMLTNGSFEKDLMGWGVNSGTIAIDKTNKKYGQQSLSIHGGGISQASPVTLLAGHTYTAQAWVTTNGAVVGNGSQGAGISFADPNQYVTLQKSNGLAVNSGSVNPGVVLASTSAVGWTQIQVTFSVSTNCALAFGLSDCYGGTTTANGTAWFDGVSLTDITGGADVTGSNTAAGIIGQGDLATINQANTVNIVAGAVNSQIVFSSTSQIAVTAHTRTQLAEATIGTSGGYVKIRCMMEVCGMETTGNTGHYPFATVNIWKGVPGSESLMFYGNLWIPPGLLDGGLSCIAIEAVDSEPALAQQYSVTMTCGNYGVFCDGISLVVENAKV